MFLNKFATAVQFGGALMTLPAGVVGLYTAYQSSFSTEATCRNLRGAILTTLDRNIDASAKRVLVHKDLTEFERTCALSDPDAKTVFAAVDRTVLFAVDPDAAARSSPVHFSPPPPLPFPHRFGDHPLRRLLERMRHRPFVI
jgi:hypothetical protein